MFTQDTELMGVGMLGEVEKMIRGGGVVTSGREIVSTGSSGRWICEVEGWSDCPRPYLSLVKAHTASF